MTNDWWRGLTRRRLIQASVTSLAAIKGAATATDVLISPATAQASTTTVENYILTRLSQSGVDKFFGIPGATCSPFFEAATKRNDISAVVTSSDLAAGQAADGYARTRGLGAVCVTYGVATMSLLPAIAGAYVERSPVVVINGGPGTEDLRIQNKYGTLFTHSIGHTQADLNVFHEVTQSADRIEKASGVPKVVDRALITAKTKSRPVYIEVAKDLWGMPCPVPGAPLDFSTAPSGKEGQLAKQITDNLHNAAKPALLLGIEIARYGLADDIVALVNKLEIPWSTTLLAKSVIPEQTAGFVGVYGGEQAPPSVRQVIEHADALFAIGCVMGRQYRNLVVNSNSKLMLAFNGTVRINGNPAQAADLRALVTALRAQPWTPNPNLIASTKLPGLSFDQRRASLQHHSGGPEPGLTYDEIMRQLSAALDDKLLVIADTSLSMYPAADLNVVGRAGFLCNAVWQFIGYSIGASLGAGLGQARRPLVICGDGGFQVTAQGLSALAKAGSNAIVVILDNGIYGIEEWLLRQGFFTDPGSQPANYIALKRWRYADLAKSMGFGFTTTVDAPGTFAQALNDARSATTPSLIAAVVKEHDLPSGLPAT
jgi:indolepyruvate decarboxylase